MADKRYYGLYQGIVTNINDPEKRGRIKVKCPRILGGSTESAWCDPLVQVAYDNGGDFCIPTKDEAVWLQFIEGDVNKPVYMGGWWQNSMTPLGSSYSEVDKVRIISYADCTILMQDGTISINIGGGVANLKIENKQVSIEGDLVVKGKIKAEDDIETKKSVSIAGDFEVLGESTLKDIVCTDVTTTGGVSLSSHTHGGVESGNSNTSVPN